MRSSWVLALALLGCGSNHHGTDASGGGGDGSNGGGGTDAPTCNANDPNCNGGTHTFAPQSLIIPMDLSYQATGMFQAYGLIYRLLQNNIHVYWMIDPQKMYHPTACNDSANPCAWDCGVEGSGVKCTYPTSSPDFMATTKVIWDDTGAVARGTMLGTHGYRGGPFAVDAADHDAALAIIDAWNTQGTVPRTVFHVVSVHETTAPFTGNVGRMMIHPPTIAVFADGHEDIATGYIRAAGIPQSSGAEFPAQTCGTSNCGPGTANPDMLTEEAIMGPLGTCANPNLDHKNGALFKADGSPAYCQIMSMHWNVSDREKVQCNGTTCPQMQSQCTGNITYNGHEVVAEVRSFLQYGTHFFAECQAVNAYENTVPNPAWPFLDDMGRDGHFLTTTGTLPTCSNAMPCTDPDYQCTNGTCQPKAGTWLDIPGYEVSTQPASTEVRVIHPEIPYNQFDGMFGTTNGSEPSYNLSTYLNTQYKNNRQVTLLTGANGPGDQDLWMTGYLDGCGQVILKGNAPGSTPDACGGKISYLGGHQYSTTVPVTSGSQSQGTRLFLNALFEADCVTGP